MNRKLALSSLVLATAFAGNAFAESPLQGNDPFSSGRSGAEVQAELHAYKQAGVNPWSTSYNPLKTFRSQTTRAAVTADYLASRDRVAAFTREDSGSSLLAQGDLPAPSVGTLAGQPRSVQ